MKYAITFLCLCLSLVVVIAQETEPEVTPEAASPIAELGVVINGVLDNQTPRAIYFFDGRRGEVINFRVEATSGNLDPVLTLFDNIGQMIFRMDDSNGSQNIDYTLTLRSSDRYYVVVGRFGYGLGTTAGGYELILDRAGVLSEEGSALRYGDSVLNTISMNQPQVYYTFRAEAGDIVNIEMIRNSGTLDPFLQVVDRNSFVIAENDDPLDGSTSNARINNLFIEEAGSYVIVASRYGETAGDSVGTFVLTIDEAVNSGTGNSVLSPLPLIAGEYREGIINEEQYEQFFTFVGRKNDIVSIALDRTTGRLDAYLILANSNLQTIFENDDGGSGQNARINSYRLPEDGSYYVIATRFGGFEGETTGNYRVLLEREGNAFDSVSPEVPRIDYGTTITGNINDSEPSDVFAFWGEQGDTVTISLSRADGDLDPVIELLDSQRRRMLRDDDSGGGKNARIQRHTLTYTGVHYIRAARYEGATGPRDTSGSYVLVLAQLAD